MTLCFLDAAKQYKVGRISWDDYLTNVLIHLTGVKHKEDDITGVYFDLLDADPFGYGIFCWNQRLGRKIADIQPFEAVFKAYRTSTVDDTRDKLAALDKEHVPEIRGSLAFLALKERQSKTLKLCLDQGGFPFESYFLDEVNRVDGAKDPETFQVLEHSHFRELFPRRSGAAAVFDKGGKFPVDW